MFEDKKELGEETGYLVVDEGLDDGWKRNRQRMLAKKKGSSNKKKPS